MGERTTISTPDGSFSAYLARPARTPAIVGALKDNPLVEIHTYPGCDHGFARAGGQHYDAAATAKAGERTLTFFQRTLG